jgi:Protein of unknown function (DUF2934)
MRLVIRVRKRSQMLARKPVARSDDVAGEVKPGSVVTASDEDIARLAYALWEARGGGDGSADEDWFEAERQLRVQEAKDQVA